MTSLVQTRNNIRKVIKDLEQTRENEYQLIVLDALALLKRRVINTGKDSEGKSFSDYSEAVVPFWYFAGKDGVSSNDVKRLKDKSGYFASYRDLREVKGRPTKFKNFSFTNKMWNSLETAALSHNNGVVVIGFKASSDREDVVNIHHEQEGLLRFSDDEIKLVRSLSKKRIMDAFKRNGL